MPSVTPAQRHAVNADPITSAHIILLEFQEAQQATVHRAAINNEDIVSNGETYVATDIDIALPGSGEEEQSVRLEMSNVSRVVGAILARARNRVGCRIMLVDTSDPDTVIIDTGNLYVIGSAELDSVRISGQLAMRAGLNEPMPPIRTSRSFFPGLWVVTQ